MPEIKIQHSSMEFSLSKVDHHEDANRVFSLGNDFVTGTESGVTNSLYLQLPVAAAQHGYHFVHNTSGEWVAVKRTFGAIIDHGFFEAIPAFHAPAADGGHGPRGIVWATVRPVDKTVGEVTVGAAHWLTERSIKASGHSNVALEKAISEFAKEAGKGSGLVFVNGDTNQPDNKANVFGGIAPLTTCWDELKEYPATHGGVKGATIDIIASYDHDGRVSAETARALTDAQFPLHSDHYTIEATYRVKPLK